MELASFAGLQFPPIRGRSSVLHPRPGGACGGARCRPPCSAEQRAAVVTWLRQTHRLANLVAQAAGERTSVHLHTSCLRADSSALWSSLGRRDGASPVVIHESFDPALLAAIGALLAAAQTARPPAGRSAAERQAYFHGTRHLASWNSNMLLNTLKWSFVAATHAKMVVFLDLDMEPTPRVAHAAHAAEHWASLLRCLERRNESFFSLSDHSTPVNTAYMIIKPNLSLYAEGVEVLWRAAKGAFNSTHGWDLVGPPRSAVPPSDPSWTMLRRKRMEMFTLNDWTFVCGATDQGFFFYIFRVRHTIGADLLINTRCPRGNSTPTGPTRRGARFRARRRVAAERAAREWWNPSGRSLAWLHHYAGGMKPEIFLNEYNACERNVMGQLMSGNALRTFFQQASSTRRTRTPAGRGNVSHPPESVAWEVARSLSWGRRALLEARLMLQDIPAATAHAHARCRENTPSSRPSPMPSIASPMYTNAKTLSVHCPSNLSSDARSGSAASLFLEEVVQFLERGTNCVETSLRRWNVSVTPRFRKLIQRRRRGGSPAFVGDHMSGYDFIHTMYTSLDDAMPVAPSIFGS
ncbi:hypothetical protein AB1Y20_006295 [Prymnesium parvum]|uniref:Protein xylosyltransferase n=1 Tax=Prymnesium parvum TaxID=97485 RepID=A0AB34J286_PRYPA